MAEKIFKTRIKQRRDTSANWESKNPVLLNGEVIIVDTANGETRTKTGNGTKTYTQLPFDDEGTKGGKSLIDYDVADSLVKEKNEPLSATNGFATISGNITAKSGDVVATVVDTTSDEIITVQHYLSKKANTSEVNNKVDKVEGKSLIDKNVADNIEYYKDSSGYPHIQISPAGPSNMKSCVFSYDGLEITEISHPSHNVVLSTSEGLVIQGEMDVTLKKGASGETLHKLSEKANTSDLEKKIGTGENYNPNASAANVINLSGLTKEQHDSGEYTEGSNVAERISGIRFDTGTATTKAQITIGSDSGGNNTVVCSRDSIVGMQNGYEIFGISANNIWCGDTTYLTMPGEVHYLKNKWEGKTYTISIPTTDWTEKTDTNNQKYYYKKITVSNMTAYGQAMTDVAMSDDVATARKQMEAYQCINRVVTGEGYVELYCFDEIPTTAFTLRVLVIGAWLG